MSITITCENPDCRQPCVVPDDLAGRVVRCPRCPALIQVPLSTSAALTTVPLARRADVSNDDPLRFDASASSPPDPDLAVPPPPTAQPSGEVAEQLAAFFRECRLSRARVILLCCSFGCFVLLIMGIMLPWQNLRGRLLVESHSRLGAATASGLTTLIITLLVISFLITSVALRHGRLLEAAIWVCTLWAALSTFWRVIDIVTFHASDSHVQRSAAFGVYFCLLSSLGALGTAGTVAFTRLSQFREKGTPRSHPQA